MSTLDKLISEFDAFVRTVFVPENRTTTRANPANTFEEPNLNRQDKRHIAGLMRVNHSGEVCAQALYQGQAFSAKLPFVREHMEQAAQEEEDHLSWCEQRLQELGSSPSALNFLWYLNSFCIGAFAGVLGDKWSLGFVVETERQVVDHLENHIKQLPQQDTKTLSLLKQMQKEELEHADMALASGAHELPSPIKKLMGLVSKVMTKTSYYI